MTYVLVVVMKWVASWCGKSIIYGDQENIDQNEMGENAAGFLFEKEVPFKLCIKVKAAEHEDYEHYIHEHPEKKTEKVAIVDKLVQEVK